MLNTQPLLNGKGLLLAMITAILSGQALADTAGRVSFVTGEVAAISNNGGKRLLNKGDLVIARWMPLSSSARLELLTFQRGSQPHVALIDLFRRAGLEWSGTKTVPLNELTPDQVESLKAEPMLVVDEVDIEPAKA